MMEYYESRHFDINNITIAPVVINELFKEIYNDFPSKPVQKPLLIANNSILLCPPTYFSPIKTDSTKSYGKLNIDRIGELRLNPDTYCIHRFNGSWVSPWRKIIYDIINKTIGVNLVKKMLILLRFK